MTQCTKHMNISGLLEISNLSPNATTRYSAHIHGWVSPNGRCERGEGMCQDHTGIHPWVTVFGAFETTLTDFTAKVRLSKDKLILGQFNIQCEYVKSHCNDGYGESIHGPHFVNCFSDQYDILYEGIAEWVTHGEGIATYKLLVVSGDNHMFAMKVVDTVRLCGSDLWTTEQARILVALRNPLGGWIFFNQPSTRPIQNTDLTTYINTKCMYVVEASTASINKLVDLVRRTLCQNTREIMLNRLSLVSLDPARPGLLIGKERGVLGRIVGEVIICI